MDHSSEEMEMKMKFDHHHALSIATDGGSSSIQEAKKSMLERSEHLMEDEDEDEDSGHYIEGDDVEDGAEEHNGSHGEQGEEDTPWGRLDSIVTTLDALKGHLKAEVGDMFRETFTTIDLGIQEAMETCKNLTDLIQDLSGKNAHLENEMSTFTDVARHLHSC
jgi:hypothetical protein